MIFKKKFYLFCLLSFGFCKLFPQTAKILKNKVLDPPGVFKIKWHKPISFLKNGKTINVLSSDQTTYLKDKDYLPYIQLKQANYQNVKQIPEIEVVSTLSLTAKEEACINLKHLTEK